MRRVATSVGIDAACCFWMHLGEWLEGTLDGWRRAKGNEERRRDAGTREGERRVQTASMIERRDVEQVHWRLGRSIHSAG